MSIEIVDARGHKELSVLKAWWKKTLCLVVYELTQVSVMGSTQPEG